MEWIKEDLANLNRMIRVIMTMTIASYIRGVMWLGFTYPEKRTEAGG